MDIKKQIDRTNLPYRQSTSAVLIDKLGRILIVQKNRYKENEWDIPGGGINPGETPIEAILRELTEEIGCSKFESIKLSKQTDHYEWPDEKIIERMSEKRETYRGQERSQFFIKLDGGETDLKPQIEEIRSLKWVYPSELKTFLIFPNQYQKMKDFLQDFGITVN